MSQEAVELHRENHLCLRCSHGDVCATAKAADPDMLQTVAFCLSFEAAESKPGEDRSYVRTVLKGVVSKAEGRPPRPGFKAPDGSISCDAIPLETIGIRADGEGDLIEVLVRDIEPEDDDE